MTAFAESTGSKTDLDELEECLAAWLDSNALALASAIADLITADPKSHIVSLAIAGNVARRNAVLQNDPTLFMTVSEKATEMGTSEEWVRKLCRTGKLAAVMKGKTWWIIRDPAEIEARHSRRERRDLSRERTRRRLNAEKGVAAS